MLPSHIYNEMSRQDRLFLYGAMLAQLEDEASRPRLI